ncbi:S-adenosyl-L-methionine-dependent methyltransferase [Roridomyces roridus]|uniref:S-adenosyl-L-methionine-dependent methyltransferase n=1 Tax=Roridomyces roridus TaxID=1738132 RepID=A0AAD7BXP2_9AGAR|nr:S-adenosyl-L-methionine-dependent methyltransferase [Roridomyces roridus]
MPPASSLPTPEHIDAGAYLLPSVSENEEEVTRLDAWHNTFREYFDGGLCAFPLKNERPQRILELGCGSGAWAIQAAADFPEAQVVAVDISPLPAHRVPPHNMTFQFVDLREELPFERESFDIVHARMVMINVPNAKDVIHKAARLVKPGGLLLLDDMDHKSTSDTGGPAVRRCIDKMMELWRMFGSDLEMGRKLQGILAETGWFSEIQVEKIAIPLGGCAHDERLNKLGLRRNVLMQGFVRAAGVRLAGEGLREGLTEEMIQGFVEELDRVGSTVVSDFYFCAARRGVLVE